MFVVFGHNVSVAFDGYDGGPSTKVVHNLSLILCNNVAVILLCASLSILLSDRWPVQPSTDHCVLLHVLLLQTDQTAMDEFCPVQSSVTSTNRQIWHSCDGLLLQTTEAFSSATLSAASNH